MGLFDAGQGNVVAYKLTTGAKLTDTGGDANGFTLTENGTVSHANGFQGGTNTAVTFSGSTANYLSRADAAALRCTNVTVRARVYLAATGTTQWFVTKGDAGTQRAYDLYYDGVTNTFRFGISVDGAATVPVASTSTASATAWYDVVGVYNGTDLRIYINGALNCTPVSQTGNIYAGTASLFIGKRGNNTFPTNGRLDDIAIWSRALSSTEVANLYTYAEDFVPTTSGTIAATLDGVSVAAVGGQTTGVIAATLSGVSVAVVCNQLIPIGNIAFTLDGVSANVTAAIINVATVAATLDGITVNANVAVPTTAIISSTLAGISVSVVGSTSSVVENFECKIRHKTTGGAITGMTTVKLRVWQPSTGLRFDFFDDTFKANPTTPEKVLTEVDSTYDPGLYRALVTTTLWSGWISMEATYNDGSYTYSYPGEASYIAGVRASGHWLPAESAQITEIQADTDMIKVALALVPTNPLLANDARLNNLDAAVSSRLPTSGYTAPDNSSIALIAGYTDSIESRLPAALVGGKMDSSASVDVSAVAAAVGARVVSGALTADQCMRVSAAILHGKVRGAGTGTEYFRDPADTKDVCVMTVDTQGNRSVVVLDAT